MSISGGERIFGSPIPIYIKNIESNVVKRSETIVHEIYFNNSAGRRATEFRIVDQADPLFIWQSIINEDEFYSMKRDQNILIDFNRFPFKLMELLQQCTHHSSSSLLSSTGEERPSFMATLAINNQNIGSNIGGGGSISSSMPKEDVVYGGGNIGSINNNNSGSSTFHQPSATFIISEYTSFKQINHVCLRMTTLNDSSLKKYLSDLIRKYREEAESLRIQLNYTTSSIPILSTSASTPTSAFNHHHHQNQHHHHPSSRSSTMAMDPMIGNGNYAYNPSRDQVYEDPSRVKNLQDKCSNLEATNKYLNDLRYSLEAELSKLRASPSGAHFAANEILLKEKQSEIAKLNELLESLKESKKHLEDTINQQKSQLSSLETNTHQLTNDINKANEIIKRLQEEIRANKNKLKNTENNFKQQEKITRNLEQTQEGLKKELVNIQQELDESRKQYTISTIDKQSLQRELEECRQRIENDQNVIAYLYNQLESQGKFREMETEINRLKRSDYHRNITSTMGNITTGTATTSGGGGGIGTGSTGIGISGSNHLATVANGPDHLNPADINILNKAKVKIP